MNNFNLEIIDCENGYIVLDGNSLATNQPSSDEFEKKEMWKPIPGFNYSVSNLGRVKNKKGLVLKPFEGRKGYLRVNLYRDKKNNFKTVHSLVLEAFVGPRPCGLQGAHLNNEKTDNRVSNLKWVTCKENIAHKEIHGTVVRGARHWCAKLTQDKADEIRRLYKRKSPGRSNILELSEKFKISKSTIQSVIRGDSWARAALKQGDE